MFPILSVFKGRMLLVLAAGIFPNSFIQFGPERREVVILRANIRLNISFIQKGAHLCFL